MRTTHSQRRVRSRNQVHGQHPIPTINTIPQTVTLLPNEQVQVQVNPRLIAYTPMNEQTSAVVSIDNDNLTNPSADTVLPVQNVRVFRQQPSYSIFLPNPISTSRININTRLEEMSD